MAYACDEQVDAAAGQEPVHEGALGGHHVRVPPRLLRSALMLAERWAWVLARARAETRRVGGGIEAFGLFEHAGLGRCGGGGADGGE